MAKVEQPREQAGQEDPMVGDFNFSADLVPPTKLTLREKGIRVRTVTTSTGRD